MKHLFYILAIFIFSSCATHNSFNTFYQKYQSESDLSFGMNAAIVRSFLDDDDMDDIEPLLKKAKHVRILVFDHNASSINQKFNQFIKHSSFDKLVKLKDDSDHISLYSLEQKDKIKEIVVQVGTDDELILLGLKTNLTQNDIDKMMQDTSISLN